MSKWLKWLMPLGILLIGTSLIALLFLNQPVATRKPQVKQLPVVRVMQVSPQDVSIPVYSRGIANPKTEIQLAAHLAGSILELSPNFVNGGFFKKDELLVRIDTNAHKVEIAKAESAYAGANLKYQNALAVQKVKVKGLKSPASATPFARYEPQVEEAKASMKAAKAALQGAKLKIKSAVIRAPFDGMVRRALVNRGQKVSPGLQLGAIFSIDQAEVRLPLTDSQLGLIDLPLQFDPSATNKANTPANTKMPNVIFSGNFSDKTYQWFGKIVRSEGTIDQRNRLSYVVATIDNPYRQDSRYPKRPPLSAGMFVEAQIEGRFLASVYVIPRDTLRGEDSVWLVDSDSRIKIKHVEIIHRGKEYIFIERGLKPTDQLILTPLDIAVDGMKVKVLQNKNTSEKPSLDVMP